MGSNETKQADLPIRREPGCLDPPVACVTDAKGALHMGNTKGLNEKENVPGAFLGALELASNENVEVVKLDMADLGGKQRVTN